MDSWELTSPNGRKYSSSIGSASISIPMDQINFDSPSNAVLPGKWKFTFKPNKSGTLTTEYRFGYSYESGEDEELAE